jgi:2-polyprenyl-3-methyl-5-hydroxy-6-metoxy-1,4-benzoquinol methylase
MPDGGWSGAVCCEVLEHIMHPELLLARISEVLRPGALFFVSTVANIEAEDHIYLFENADQIRELINTSGFVIKAELILPLPGFAQDARQPLNYAAIVSKEG